MTESSRVPVGIATEEPPFLPTQRQFFTILLAYFSLLLIFKTLLSETAGIDEANQLVVGQKLSWGYGPHAPLYTWLMILFLHAFGSSEFSLTLLRELLLFGTYALTYFNTRLITRSHACGVAAAVALQFHPTIVWESQRELTHSLVASLMILATLFAFLRLRPERWTTYLRFGVCGGLTVLSKYNAVLFWAAMLISGASLVELRPRVFNWRMLLAVAVSLLVAAPNLIWVFNHPDVAFEVHKFGINPSLSWGQSVRAGLLTWVETTGAHLAVLLAVFAVLFWRPIFVERVLRLHNAEEKFLWRVFLTVAAMIVLSVFLFRVTEFKDRWLQPLFVATSVLLAAALHDGLDRARLKVLLLSGLIISILTAVVAPGRLFLTEWRGRREVLNAPFRKFAADIAPMAQQSDFIVGGGYWLAGNLRLWFPDKQVFSPDLAPPDVRAGRRCLVVWDATKRPDAPAELQIFAVAFTGKESTNAAGFIEEKWKFHREKTMRLGLWVLENSSPGR